MKKKIKIKNEYKIKIQNKYNKTNDHDEDE